MKQAKTNVLNALYHDCFMMGDMNNGFVPVFQYMHKFTENVSIKAPD